MTQRAPSGLRSYLGIAISVVLVLYVSFLTPLNFELLVEQRFKLNSDTSIPVYAALLVVFLAGLLPAALFLVAQTLERELSRRRARRRSREQDSLDYRFRRAVDFEVDGQWAKAAAELEVLLTERPDDFASLLLYGEVLRLGGRAEEALEAHRRASTLDPQSIALLYHLADDYEAAGEAEVGREIRNRILRDFSDHGLQVMRRRRDTAMAAEDWDGAWRWHERIEATQAESTDSMAAEYEAGVSRGLTYQRGLALLERERAEEAARIFRQLLEAEPLFVPAGIMLGEAELMLDNEEGAIEEWRKGFRISGSPVFLKRLEDHFIENEEPARAIETLRSLIAQSENDLVLRFFLGRLYYRLEMHEKALEVLEGLGERLDSVPIYHYLMGRLCQRRNDPRGAMARYLTCLHRMGVANASFVCHRCEARLPDWRDRCPSCGRWNSVDLDVPEEQLGPGEMGVADRPVWGGYEIVEESAQDPIGA